MVWFGRRACGDERRRAEASARHKSPARAALSARFPASASGRARPVVRRRDNLGGRLRTVARRVGGNRAGGRALHFALVASLMMPLGLPHRLARPVNGDSRARARVTSAAPIHDAPLVHLRADRVRSGGSERKWPPPKQLHFEAARLRSACRPNQTLDTKQPAKLVSALSCDAASAP